MTAHVKVSGAWKELDTLSTKVSGSWKNVTNGYVKVSGAWKEFFTASKPGMVLVKPTSITHSGTSATLGANGQVTFSAVTSLSLNGCFTSDFDNYVVTMRHEGSAAYPVYARLRASASDATGSDYTWQYILASSTTVNALRSSDSYWLAADAATTEGGVTIHIYGPALAQPTAFRKVDNYPNSSATIIDGASTHSLSTAYDGFSLIMLGGRTITGALQVYGVRS